MLDANATNVRLSAHVTSIHTPMTSHMSKPALALVVLAFLACGGGDGAGTTPPPPPPPAVTSVTVEPSATTLIIGASATLTATLRAATGAVLQGRPIVWTSSNTAAVSVSQTGTVTALAPGQAAITATSEGVSGSAAVAVLEPVAQVTITGATRVKVGDTYTYSAVARTGSGAIVVRPVAWRVVDPTRGSMTTGGALTPLQPGVITVEVVIDNVPWQGSVTAYDWTPLTSATVTGTFLPADVLVTNKFGQSEYPLLTVGCASGTFITFVSLDRFVTANGGVAFSFDGGTIFTQTWLESDDFDALIYPGLTNLARKNFAVQIAASRAFGFGFTEFQGSAKATIFRATGMAAAIAPSLAACPGNSVVAGLDGVQMLRELQGAGEQSGAEVAMRRALGPQATRAPELIVTPVPRMQEAVRVGAQPEAR